MILGFRQPIVSIFYVVGIGLLCLHLSHGLSAMFQSLGLRNKGWQPFIGKAAKVIAILLFVGYCVIPIAVLTGLVGGSVK
jgi:succinate dehydrogenase / fumarate reductase cytochrome b subunit